MPFFSGARSSMRTRCARSSGRGRPTTSPWESVPTMRAGLSSRSDIKLIQICFWVDLSTHFLLQGDYNNYQCGLTVAAATAEDNGEWECDFESYVKVFLENLNLTTWILRNFGIYQLSCLFRVEAGGVDTKLPGNSKSLLSCRQRQQRQQQQQRLRQRPL